MTLLVDGDIVVFRAAFSAEDEEEAFIAASRADTMLDEMVLALDDNDVEVWLSGENNFRYSVFPEYKANRLDAKRPKWEKEVRTYLIDRWAANVSDGCEADDMLGSRACQYQGGFGEPEPIICTIDKDLDMIPGWHYNFVKKEKYYITNEQAIYNFYYQLLVGDTADGVKGVPNIGPVKAKRILGQCSTEKEMYDAVLNMFSCYEEFEMNAKVLWIWREKDGIWKDGFKETVDKIT